MTPKEAGFILLTSHLGDPKRPVLTQHMMLTVHKAVSQARKDHPDENLSTGELLRMGVKPDLAQRITFLMSQQQQMKDYVQAGLDKGYVPLTPVSEQYPELLLKRRGYSAPGCLWACGDLSIMDKPLIGSVGSRELNADGKDFARTIGEECARQGYGVVSGHAKGADFESEYSCIFDGGRVVTVLPCGFEVWCNDPDFLYLTEYDYDLDFTTERALSRNHTIHSMGIVTLVCQSTEGKGGTWRGTTENLKHKWSPVGCSMHSGPGNYALHALGAKLVHYDHLYNLPKLIEMLYEGF